MRPEQKRHASATLRLPPANDSLDEAILEGRVRRRVPHDDDERELRVEVERPDDGVELLTRTRARVDVGLRPAGDHDSVVVDLVVSDQVVPHRRVLDDVDVAEGCDHALADRVIPARDVRDDRDARGVARPRGTGRRTAAGRSTARVRCSRGACARREPVARSASGRTARRPFAARGGPSAGAARRATSRASSSRALGPCALGGNRVAGSAGSQRVVADRPVEPPVHGAMESLGQGDALGNERCGIDRPAHRPSLRASLPRHRQARQPRHRRDGQTGP